MKIIPSYFLNSNTKILKYIKFSKLEAFSNPSVLVLHLIFMWCLFQPHKIWRFGLNLVSVLLLRWYYCIIYNDYYAIALFLDLAVWRLIGDCDGSPCWSRFSEGNSLHIPWWHWSCHQQEQQETGRSLDGWI